MEACRKTVRVCPEMDRIGNLLRNYAPDQSSRSVQLRSKHHGHFDPSNLVLPQKWVLQ
jgi:hypothetical protein